MTRTPTLTIKVIEVRDMEVDWAVFTETPLGHKVPLYVPKSDLVKPVAGSTINFYTTGLCLAPDKIEIDGQSIPGY